MFSVRPIVTFHSQACISFEYQDRMTLCDPWFEGDVFNRSWSLLKKPNLETIDFSKLKYIWISHQHPDHLHFSTLKKIRDLASPHLPTIYFRERDNKDVVQSIRALGFQVVELKDHERTQMYDDVWVTSFPTGMDCAAVFDVGGTTILNQNDCQLDDDEVRILQRQYPHIDTWFFQFSLAGYYANSDDIQGLKEAKCKHLALIQKYFQAFKPDIYVPFASFVYFSKRGNAYLNDWHVGLRELRVTYPEMPIQVMYVDDRLLWQDWGLRNEKNIALWEQAKISEVRIKDIVSVPESDIQEAAQNFFQQILRLTPAILRPWSMVLKLGDVNRYFVLDLRRCEIRFLQDLSSEGMDSRDVAGVLNGEDLLFFLRFPWGADTLNITAAFKVLRPFQWWWLVYFKHAIYKYHRKWKWYTILLPLAGAILRALKYRRGEELPEVEEFQEKVE